MNLKETQLFYLVSSKRSLLLYHRLVRDENLKEVLVSSFFRADNYTAAKEILVNDLERLRCNLTKTQEDFL